MRTKSSSTDEELVTVAVIERYKDAPDECTIHPDRRYHSEVGQTEWISAQEGSYISLDFVR